MRLPIAIKRDPRHAIIAGVCSGIARHYQWNVVKLRIVFALGLIVTVGAFLLLYLLCILLMPLDTAKGDAPTDEEQRLRIQQFVDKHRQP